MLPLVAGVALIWILSVVQDATRNVRFLVAAAIFSAAWVGASTLRGDARSVVAAGLSVLIFVALVRPDLFGLSSVSRGEQRIDAAFRRLAPMTLDPAHAAEARAALGDLEQTTPRTLRYWHLAIHLLQQVAERHADPQPAAWMTPTLMLQQVARRYAYIARTRQVLGRRQHPTLSDEDVVLRSYLEDYRAAVPAEAEPDEAIVSLGSWNVAAERAVDDLAGVTMSHAGTRRTRDYLVAHLRADLDVRRGDRSQAAITWQRATSESLDDQWRELRVEIANWLATAGPRTHGIRPGSSWADRKVRLGERGLEPRERAVLLWILERAPSPCSEGLIAQVDGARVSGGVPTNLRLTTDTSARPADCRDGPIPVRAIVDGRDGKPVGELIVWVREGRLSGLEYPWYTDEAPTVFPEVAQLRVIPSGDYP